MADIDRNTIQNGKVSGSYGDDSHVSASSHVDRDPDKNLSVGRGQNADALSDGLPELKPVKNEDTADEFERVRAGKFASDNEKVTADAKDKKVSTAAGSTAGEDYAAKEKITRETSKNNGFGDRKAASKQSAAEKANAVKASILTYSGIKNTAGKEKEEDKKPRSRRTTKILSLNGNKSSEGTKSEITKDTKEKITVSGNSKVRSGKSTPEISELKDPEPDEKIVTGAVGNTPKVRALSKLRGEGNEKVSAKSRSSGKVSTNPWKERIHYNGLPEGKVAPEAQINEEKKKKDKKTVGVIGAALLSSFLPLLLVLLIIAGVLVFLMNSLSLVLAGSLKEGYDEILEEAESYDYGYDRATYLLTKYGLSGNDQFSYDLKNTLIIGGKEIRQFRWDDKVKGSVFGSKIYGFPELKLSDEETYSYVKMAAEDLGEDIRYAVFSIGIDDIRFRQNENGAASFAENYEELIKTSFLENAGSSWKELKSKESRVLVLSIMDTSDKDPSRDLTQADTIGEYNRALKSMCLKNKGWCFVDLDPLLDEDSYSEDGVTLTSDFYKRKFLPYLCDITGNDYQIGRSSKSMMNTSYGLYDLDSKGTLLNLLSFLYRYKNTDDIYDEFSGFKNMKRKDFNSETVRESLPELWDKVFSCEGLYKEKMYADQQAFMVEDYYKDRVQQYLECQYSLNLKGGSYALKAAIISMAYEFGYSSGEDFDDYNESDEFIRLFAGIDWTKGDLSIIDTIYQSAAELRPEKAGRFQYEHEDCIAMYEDTIDIYELSENDYGFINWTSHLDADGKPPKDKIALAPEASRGTGIICYALIEMADHDETCGETAYRYTQFALSFADPKENYGSGHYKLPYVLGGASLVYGADCSGFVGQILAAFGYIDQSIANSHGYCSGDFRNLGNDVPISDIRIGDVVCYEGHVAIYIGNNEIVHEPSMNRSCGVEIGYLYGLMPVCIRRFDMTAPKNPYEKCDFFGDSRTLCMANGGTYAYEFIPTEYVHATWGGTLDTAAVDISHARNSVNKAFFWYGINDVGINNTYDLNECLGSFKTKYMNLLDIYTMNHPVVNEIYIISILDTAKTDNTWTPGQHDRIVRYNEVLKEICSTNAKYTYIDVTSLFTEQEKGGEGGLLDDIHFSWTWYNDIFLPTLMPYIKY